MLSGLEEGEIPCQRAGDMSCKQERGRDLGGGRCAYATGRVGLEENARRRIPTPDKPGKSTFFIWALWSRTASARHCS